MQSYFGDLTGEVTLPMLDHRVSQHGIGTQLDVSAQLPEIPMTVSPPNSDNQPTLTLPGSSILCDEDILICGRCKAQFSDINVFLLHKKEGCIASSQTCGESTGQATLQLPDPLRFESVQRNSDYLQNLVLNNLTANPSEGNTICVSQSISVENNGLNLTQNPAKSIPVNTNLARDAVENSSLCVLPSNAHQQPGLGVNMSEVNNLVQVHGHAGFLQTNVSMNERATGMIVPDDILVNSSSAQTAFSTNPHLQESEASNQSLSGIVLGNNGSMSTLLQQLQTQHHVQHQASSSLGNTQQVYIQIQPQQQFETQTTYSILPKETTMVTNNYAVGLNLSAFNVSPVTINASTASLCLNQVGGLQPQQQAVQLQAIAPKPTEIAKQNEPSAPSTVGVQISDLPIAGNPISATTQKKSSKKMYTCEYCWKGFKKPFDLEQHIRSHTGEKPFQCIVCGRAFAQKSNVRKHMESHKVWPKEALDVVPKANVISTSSSVPGGDQSLNDPQIVASLSINKKPCPYCGQVLGSHNERKSHMLRHKDKQVYKCVKEGCEQTFKDLEVYVDHVKTHEGTMKYRCHHCCSIFTSLEDLGIHQYREHLGDRSKQSGAPNKFKCKLCPAKFGQADGLQKHMIEETHKHPCSLCDKLFSCEKYLLTHMKAAHSGAPRKKYKCEECGALLNSIYYLRSHMLIHTKETPFKCETCQAAFNRKDKLVRHMVTHDPVKKFKCPFKDSLGCKKEFNRADKLKAHIISHNGIKIHKCSYCAKRFTRRGIRLAHEKTHTGQFKCKICERSFISQKVLQSHKCKSTPADCDATMGTHDNSQSNAPFAIQSDSLSYPDGPMYAIRSGSKRRHLKRNVSRPTKDIYKRSDLKKSKIDVNIGSQKESEFDVDIEGNI